MDNLITTDRESIHLDAAPPAQSGARLRSICLMSIAVFLAAFLFLFLGMDRQCGLYDEGLVLVGAMRVAAGNVPHRDFYANYGPAEFYILAGQFKLFGPSVLVERIFDLSVKAGVVTACFAWCAVYCRKSIAIMTALVCWSWLYSLSFYGPPTTPALLLSLAGSGLFLSAYTHSKFNWRMPVAGALTGLTALFRYDIGIGLLGAHLCFIAIRAFTANRAVRWNLRSAILPFCLYIAGIAIVFVPPALMYLAVAPVRSFLFDIVVYPSKYYARARNLPFPGLHPMSALVVYLPIIVMGLLLALLLMKYGARKQDSSQTLLSFDQGTKIFFVLFGLLIPVFYCKGFVRITPIQMFLSIAPSLIVLGVLLEHTNKYNFAFRSLVAFGVIFSVGTAACALIRKSQVLFLEHTSVLAELISPPGPASIRNLTSWCGTPNPLHKGLCFIVDADHIEAINFIDSHTEPNDELFIGLPHHDKIWANDILTYFAAQRVPATHWYHFDPDLQTRADIQREMIQDIQSKPVPYILLDSEFDNSHEPNDSSKSSGVTLLDDFIRTNYHQVRSFGELSVWQKNPSAGLSEHSQGSTPVPAV